MDIEKLLEKLNDETTQKATKMAIIEELKLRCNSERKNGEHTDDYIEMRYNHEKLLKVAEEDKNHEVRKGTIEILKNFIGIDDTANQVTQFLFKVIENDKNFGVKKAAVDVLGVAVESKKLVDRVDRRIIEFLIKTINMYNHGDYIAASEEVRVSIATVLGQCNFRNIKYYYPLIDILGDSSRKVVLAARSSIQKIARRESKHKDKLMTALEMRYAASILNRAQIAYILGSIPYIDEAMDLLKNNPDPTIVKMVLEGLNDALAENHDWICNHDVIDRLRIVQQNFSDEDVRAELVKLIGLIFKQKSPKLDEFAKTLNTADFIFLFSNITDDKLIKEIIEYTSLKDSTAIDVLCDKNVTKECKEIILKKLHDNFAPGRLIGESLNIALEGKKYNKDNLINLRIELMKAMYEYNRDIPGLIESIYIEEKKGDNGNCKEMIRSFAKFLEEDGYIYNPKTLSKDGIANFVNKCIAFLFKLVGKEWKYEPRIGVKSDVEASKVKEYIQTFKEKMQQSEKLNMKEPDKDR